MTVELPASVRFPDCLRCPLLAAGPAEVCLACAARRLDRPGRDACATCAQRTAADGRCRNELCHSPRRRVGRIYAIAYQSGSLRRAIHGYKYRGERHWTVIFARLLLAWLDQMLLSAPPGLIVANPGFTGPAGQRFAHAEAVIEAAAHAGGRQQPIPARWEFDSAAVVKTRATARSADAAAWSKRASTADLRQALRVPDPARTRGRHVLVYDDVCTTGSQLDAVAGCLLDQGGADRVDAVVLARAPWRGPR